MINTKKNCYIHTIIYFHGKVNRTTKQNASVLFKLLFFVDFQTKYAYYKDTNAVNVERFFSNLPLSPPRITQTPTPEVKAETHIHNGIQRNQHLAVLTIQNNNNHQNLRFFCPNSPGTIP